MQIWRTCDGEVMGEISLPEADQIAGKMGVPIYGIYAIYSIPAPEHYAISAEGRARLHLALEAKPDLPGSRVSILFRFVRWRTAGGYVL